MISIKKGDTFAFYANITDELGAPLITDVANLKSQIRNKHYVLIAELIITATATNGQYLFTAPNTNNWLKSGNSVDFIMDIEINIGGIVSSSETIDIEVIKDVTYNE